MKKAYGILLIVCVMFLAGCSCEHKWMDADCVTPKTCMKCMETSGDPLGHTWQEATCTEPKICAVCQETDGEPLGHSMLEAACVDPQVCAVCQYSEKATADHKWNAATCTQPQICSACGKKQGKALGHKGGDWKIESIDPVTGTKKMVRLCTECDSIAEEKEQSLDKMHDGNRFYFTPNQFAQRMQLLCKDLSDTLEVKIVDENGNALMVIEDTADKCEVLWCSFMKGSTFIESAKVDDVGVDVVAIQICDADDIVLLRPVLFALDTSFKLDEKHKADFTQFLEGLLSVGAASRNDVAYTYEVDSRGMPTLIAFAGKGDEIEVPIQEEHDYKEEIIAKATYFKTGYKTLKCTKCGKSDGSKIPYYLWNKAFIREGKYYSIFIVFDEDAKKVFYFTTDDGKPSEMKYTGTFSSGVTIYWDGFTEKFIYKTNSEYATLIDGNGLDWEYKVCDVEKAQYYLEKMES